MGHGVRRKLLGKARAHQDQELLATHVDLANPPDWVKVSDDSSGVRRFRVLRAWETEIWTLDHSAMLLSFTQDIAKQNSTAYSADEGEIDDDRNDVGVTKRY